MGRNHYRVGEVATLTQVSVRTLHHYDRIGLLRPAAHSTGGYRLYGEDDLLRLQQILTLRYLGFPLKRIGELLDRPDFDLVASLRVQQQALRERIGELERISAAVGELVARRLETGEWSWEHVIEASQAVGAGLTQREKTMEAHYTPEQMKQFAAVGEAVGAEEIEAIQEAWTALLTEIRANYDLDPASPEAQALSDRADALKARTLHGYESFPEL
jgi:DNA-binding transcriptional MerR regulator